MAKRRSKVRKTNTKNWGARGTSVPVPATIEIPSGRCPYVMEDTSREAVAQWVVLVTENKHEKLTYKDTVYKYWARHSFDVNAKEYHQVVRIIDELVPERVYNTSDLMFSVSDFVEDE